MVKVVISIALYVTADSVFLELVYSWNLEFKAEVRGKITGWTLPSAFH